MAKKTTAKKAAKRDGSPDLEWLAALEEQVAAATGRLAELREDNDRLGARVEELEAALDDAAAQAREAAADDGDGDGAEAAEAWREERRKIRGRVERLTATLEGLLQD